MEFLSDELLDEILILDTNGCVRFKEDNRYEYKANIDWGNDIAKIKYLKELVALSNAGGGYLIFGINDKTYQPTGLIGEQSIDLKLVTDWYQKYFAPAIVISGRTYQKDGFNYFIIYSYKFSEIPCIAIKERDEIRNGSLYYRYSGKSEPIKGNDLIKLLFHIKRDSASYDLLNHSQSTRKKELQPKFYYDAGGSSDPQNFKVRFTNKGARAFVKKVVNLKDSNSYVDSACSNPRFIEKNEIWTIFGRYKGNFDPSNRTYKFRMYFSDEDENLYYQEFEGKTGTVNPTFVTPIETSKNEMDLYIEQNR